MYLIATGVNHRTAPVEVRERVMLLQEELPQAVAKLKGMAPEGAILSTCNRTEVYAIVSDPAHGVQAAKHFLAGMDHFTAAELEPHLYAHVQEEAVRHLFGVASGIDSQVLGETEILGQVRGALTCASDGGAVGLPLSRLFHAALRTGRLAREQTAISRHAASVSSAGVALARRVFGSLESCRVLVISAGEAGALTARCLKDAGALEIGVANRTRPKAEELARELGALTVNFEAIPQALMEYDVVISATASTKFVVHQDAVAQAMAKRGGRPLCLIDIAVPRDIDPETGRIGGVHLFDIDDLEAVSLLGLREREKAVGQVRRIVEAEASRFMHWFSTLEAVPVIRALHEKGERIRERELRKSLKRLSHLTPEDQERVDALTKALTRKLLHDPISALKEELLGDGNIDAARRLFALGEGAPPKLGQA